MKTIFCDVCGIDTTGENYNIILRLDQYVLSEVDVCVEHHDEVEKILKIKKDET